MKTPKICKQCNSGFIVEDKVCPVIVDYPLFYRGFSKTIEFISKRCSLCGIAQFEVGTDIIDQEFNKFKIEINQKLSIGDI